MLSWLPLHVASWNGNAGEAVIFHAKVSSLRKAILECRSEPWVDETRHVDSGCCDEVMPGRESVITVPEKYHNEDHDGEEMCCLEEFVAEISV